MDCSALGLPVPHYLLEPPPPKFMSIDSVMPSNHLTLCLPLLLLPSISPSIRVFYNDLGVSIRWPEYWGFSYSISPSSEYSGVISFRIDWFDPLAVKGTLQRLLQHHSLKASILWHSPFFILFSADLTGVRFPGSVRSISLDFALNIGSVDLSSTHGSGLRLTDPTPWAELLSPLSLAQVSRTAADPQTQSVGNPSPWL